MWSNWGTPEAGGVPVDDGPVEDPVVVPPAALVDDPVVGPESDDVGDDADEPNGFPDPEWRALPHAVNEPRSSAVEMTAVHRCRFTCPS
jgi:hypothetical protein